MTKNKGLYKWLIFVFLLAILIIRLLIKDGQSKAIQIISLLGVIVAFIDLYNDLYKVNYKKDKFQLVSGLAMVIIVILMIILAGMFWNCIVLGSKGNDTLTILALLISLPSDLYCSWIMKYIDN